MEDSEGTTTASGSDRLKPKRRLSRAASLPSPSSPTLNHASASPSSSYFHKNLSGTGAASLAVASGSSAEGSRGKEKEEVGEPGDIKLMGMKLKHVSLVTLALQNACLAIVMHRSRISVSPTHAYSPATAVLLNELLKGSISLVIAFKRIDDEMTLNPPSTTSSSSQLRPSSSSSLMSPSPSAGYLNEKDKDKSMGPASPIFPSSRTGGGFMPSLVGGLAGSSSAGGGSSLRGGAGVKQSIAGLPTNLSSLRRSPLVVFVNKDWRSRFKRLGSEIFSPDCWKLSIPAILYVLQNNLQYVAAENLDVATFQVTYQMKILTTAFFSVLLLGRRLSQSKWLALLLLAIGVGIVQIQSSAPKPSVATISATTTTLHHAAHAMSPFTGFSAVAAACFTSGLAGVYFEKVLKGSQADLWVRNVQLSLFSLIPAIAPVLVAPSHLPAGCGVWEHLLAPFHDFGFWAWTTVFVQVAGGLVTALVIKYSSNIMKGFATSLSIVISFLVSVGFFGARITPGFVLGSSTVLMATWMYNQPETAGGGTGAGAKGGRKGSGEKERRIPGSPVPSDAPIIGDFSRKPNHSSSMVNLQNLISSVLTPTPSRTPSGNNSPTPSFGYHVNEQGLTALNNPFLSNSGGASSSTSTGEPVYWTGSRPPSRPSSRTGRNGGPPAGLTVNTSF